MHLTKIFLILTNSPVKKKIKHFRICYFSFYFFDILQGYWVIFRLLITVWFFFFIFDAHLFYVLIFHLVFIIITYAFIVLWILSILKIFLFRILIVFSILNIWTILDDLLMAVHWPKITIIPISFLGRGAIWIYNSLLVIGRHQDLLNL